LSVEVTSTSGPLFLETAGVDGMIFWRVFRRWGLTSNYGKFIILSKSSATGEMNTRVLCFAAPFEKYIQYKLHFTLNLNLKMAG